MSFNSSKDGFQNEGEFVNKLDNKTINEVDFSMRFFLEDLYGTIDDNDIVKCYVLALINMIFLLKLIIK